MSVNKNARWESSVSSRGLTDFFPRGFDRTNLIDVSTLGCKFSQYIRKSSGQIVDCADFYQSYLDEVKAES